MKRAAMVLAWILPAIHLMGQYTISGTVLDETGHPLPGANVLMVEVERGAVTSEEGIFSMPGVEGGEYTLEITYVGYETYSQSLNLTSGRTLDTIRMKRLAVMGEEVIVTAVRAGENDPVAFRNVNREEIRTRNFGQDVPYLLSLTPSLVTTSDAGHGIGYTSMRIRGTDANRINVTINGIPLNDAESHSVYWVDLPDIATSVDNIQIQRGAGTSTNGAAAFGASVNIQTRKLNRDPYATYDGTFGSFSTFRHAVSAGTGLIKDHFSADLRLSDLRSDGYIDRSWTNLQSYYLSAGYHDSNTLVKFITFSGREELYQAWNGVPSYLLESDRTYNELGLYTDSAGNIHYYENQVDHYLQTHYQLHMSRSFSANWHANAALHLTRGAGYYEEFKQDATLASYLLPNVVSGPDTIFRSDLVRRKWLDNDFYGVVGGLHYQDRRISALLGGGWNRYVGDHFGTVIWTRISGDNGDRPRWYENRGIKSDWNTYLKGSLETGPILSLFADLQVRGIDYGIDGLDDDLRDITQEHRFLFFNPKAGLNFQLSPRHRVYLFVARAHREPNRSNFVDADPTGPVPEAESLLDFETGYAIGGKHFQLNANFYYMDYTDQLVLTGEINDVGSAVMSNVKDSYRTGLELSGHASVSSSFVWTLNATISSNRILNYTGYVDNWDFWSDPDNQPYQVKEQLGTTNLAFSPPVIIHSQAEYEILKGLKVSLMSQYVAKQYIDNTSSEERILEPYFINDLRVSFRFDPPYIEEASLMFQVSNLFNERYESNAWIYRYYEGGQEKYLDGFFPQAGTHWMAGIRLNF